MRLSIATVGLIGVAASCRAPIGQGRDAAQSGGFVVTLGDDTVSAEAYSRVGNRTVGTVMRRVPRVVVVRYAMTRDASGRASRFEYETRLADGSIPPGGAKSVVAIFTADSVFTTIVRDSVMTVRVAARNPYPEVDGSVSLYGLPIATLATMQRDSARFTAYPPGAPSGDATPVARRGPRSYVLHTFGYPIDVVTDDRGDVVSVDATRTTYRVRSQRQPVVDVAALATEFARREAVAGPVTALSPRDTARATVGGARIQVDYGRPSVRGRRVFGPDGVLGDTLWRTGANQGTELHTDVAISVAGQILPAGTYRLATLAVPGRYQLIFYEADRERARAPLQATPLAESVERFTISIDATGERSGTIRLRWATTELAMSFSVP